MRKHQFDKIKKKKLSKKYSCFELEKLSEEIQEYQHLLKSIGIKNLTNFNKKLRDKEEFNKIDTND